MTQRAGFIGLGNIGKPMAVQLAKSEFSTVVYDINPKACEELAAEGAAIASSPAELAAQCHYILCPPTSSTDQTHPTHSFSSLTLNPLNLFERQCHE